MKIQTLAFLGALGLTVTGCNTIKVAVSGAHAGGGISGSGVMTTRTVDVAGCHSVRLTSSGQLTITIGDKESLTISAEDNVLPLLTSEVSDGQLVLGNKPGTNFSSIKEIKYTLTVKKLDGIDLPGSGEVVANGIKAEALKIDVSGSGDITLNGSANNQTIDISGSGQVQGIDLKGKSVKVVISGSGKAIVAVADKLDADISGSGSVEYYGKPIVTKRLSGSGSVEQH